MSTSSDSGPEIHVSASSEAPPSPPPKERKSVRDLLFGTRRRTTIVGAVVMVAVLGVSYAVYSGDQAHKEEPVEAMESFLEAARDGDLDEAHKFMSESAISRFHENSLDPAIYASEWEIGTIELADFYSHGDVSTATVKTEIIAPDGTRVSKDSFMKEEGSTWVVSNPYSEFRASVDEYRHLQVNGQQLETQAGSSPNSLYVLPGNYTLDEPDVDWIQLKYDTVLVLVLEHATTHSNPNIEVDVDDEGEITGSSVPSFTFDLRENAQEKAQERIDAYLDNCMDDVLENIGCPVSISPNDLNAVTDGNFEFDESTVHWEITEHPEAQVILGSDSHDSPLFSFDTRTPGEAKLTAPAEGDNGSTDMAVQCSFGIDLLEPSLEFDGNIYIGPLENPRDRPRTDTPVDDMDCAQAG